MPRNLAEAGALEVFPAEVSRAECGSLRKVKEIALRVCWLVVSFSRVVAL